VRLRIAGGELVFARPFHEKKFAHNAKRKNVTRSRKGGERRIAELMTRRERRGTRNTAYHGERTPLSSSVLTKRKELKPRRRRGGKKKEFDSSQEEKKIADAKFRVPRKPGRPSGKKRKRRTAISLNKKKKRKGGADAERLQKGGAARGLPEGRNFASAEEEKKRANQGCLSERKGKRKRVEIYLSKRNCGGGKKKGGRGESRRSPVGRRGKARSCCEKKKRGEAALAGYTRRFIGG